MTPFLPARAERVTQSWSFRRRSAMRDGGAYVLSLLAVLAVDGLVVLAIGYSLWSILRTRS